jgi:hypothetical protein
MKAVCEKHYKAYDVSTGCLDCQAMSDESFEVLSFETDVLDLYQELALVLETLCKALGVSPEFIEEDDNEVHRDSEAPPQTGL